MDPNGKLECKMHCLEEGSFKFFGLQVCEDFKKTSWGYTSIFSAIDTFSEKEYWVWINRHVLCTKIFYCNFREIHHKCNFQWLFSSMGIFAFVAMKLKHHLIACQMESAICSVKENWMKSVVEIGEYTSLRMSRQCIYVK